MFERIARSFLYHPTRLRLNQPLPPHARDAEELWIPTSGDQRIHALHWTAPPGRPTILFLHGNAQSVYEWALVRFDLAPLDCGLLLIDYPGYGKSPGKPTEAGLYAAGRAALAWLLRDRPAEAVVIFGKSLGGAVATEVAQGRRLGGVVLESTFRSVPAVAAHLFPLLPVGRVLRSERYDSASRIGALETPVLIVHGDRDELVPVAEGRALHSLSRAPKRLFLVPGAGHNDVAMVAGVTYGTTLRVWLDGLGAA